MSDADDQMGGQGGETGKAPGDPEGEGTDPLTGAGDDKPATGEKQAAANEEVDPPA